MTIRDVKDTFPRNTSATFVFPIDKSIFTGKVEAREIMERRPLEWEHLNQHPDNKKKRSD